MKGILRMNTCQKMLRYYHHWFILYTNLTVFYFSLNSNFIDQEAKAHYTGWIPETNDIVWQL